MNIIYIVLEIKKEKFIFLKYKLMIDLYLKYF
jgi:hypothetical protein